jgi:hypothetical protein
VVHGAEQPIVEQARHLGVPALDRLDDLLVIGARGSRISPTFDDPKTGSDGSIRLTH